MVIILIILPKLGTGKTLAYLLPMMQKLKEEEEKGIETVPGRPRGIVILPNRELAEQVLVSVTCHHQLVSFFGPIDFGSVKNITSKVIILASVASRCLTRVTFFMFNKIHTISTV
jgi:superfamily II DNA/RNA helicase